MNTDVIGLALLLGVGLIVFALTLVGYTAWMLTHPPRRGYAWAVARNAPGDPSEVRVPEATRAITFSEWTCEVPESGSRTLRMPVWDVQGWNARGPVVVIVHGWGDARVTMLARLPWLIGHASRIVIADLAGHGESTTGAGPATRTAGKARRGSCSLGLREVEHVRELVRQIASQAPEAASARGGSGLSTGSDEPVDQRSDVDARAHPNTHPKPVPVVLMGFSLGAGVCLAAAAWDDSPAIAGVIAEAPYRLPRTPAERVLGLRGLPSGWTLRVALGLVGLRHRAGLSWFGAEPTTESGQPFDRAAWAARVQCPLLVLHGDRDDICPMRDGEEIAAASALARFARIPGAAHLSIWTDPACAAAAGAEVQDFLRQFSDNNHQATITNPARAELTQPT